MKTMGEIIAQKRKELNMTQVQLAEKMCVTDKAVSKWERNLSCPDVNSLSTLSKALEIPVDELLNAKKPETPQKEWRKILHLILKAVPLAMGVAVTVLSFLGRLEAAAGLTLLGLGVACLAVSALAGEEK